MRSQIEIIVNNATNVAGIISPVQGNTAVMGADQVQLPEKPIIGDKATE